MQQPEVEIIHNYKEFQKVILDETEFREQKYEIDKKDEKEEKEEKEEIKVNKKFLNIKYEDAHKKIVAKINNRLIKLLDMAQNSAEFEWNGGCENTICKKAKLNEKKFFE
jgi:hypothetical protein